MRRLSPKHVSRESFFFESGELVHVIPQTVLEGVWSLSFCPDGRRLASAGNARKIKLWDTETGLELLTLNGHKDFVFSACFSPDGRKLVSSSWDRTVLGQRPEAAGSLCTCFLRAPRIAHDAHFLMCLPRDLNLTIRLNWQASSPAKERPGPD
jgi:hypothetical protein